MTTQNDVQGDERYRLIGNAGFVGLVETMGSDSTIEQSARVSYGSAPRGQADRRALIRYLMRHRHSSPFEQAEVRFHIKLPIFVMRQLVRHRTANLNEYSGRYSEMSSEMYMPEHWRKQSKENKQGSGEDFEDRENENLRDQAGFSMGNSYIAYREYERAGVAKELARIVLPVANYTELYWKIDLHNFFHFLKLRTDKHSQFEIREFAEAMLELAKPHFPLSFAAWEDYVLNAITLSRMEVDLLRDYIVYAWDRDKIEPTDIPEDACRKRYGLSQREWDEFVETWDLAYAESPKLERENKE